jgi:nitrile hydratase subunit alpha
MADHHEAEPRTASISQRAVALETVLTTHGILPEEESTNHAEEQWVTRNGAEVVARAWTDSAFRDHLLRDGKSAVEEMGFGMPEHHRHLVVLENTANVHNLIVCTLCSCTAYTIIGAAPDWYKDLEYRARVVRESRTALKEVLPVRPPATRGWPAEQQMEIVTQDSLIGTSRLDDMGFQARS